MAGGKKGKKMARIYFTLMVLLAIAFMIVQLAKKKVNEMNMIVMVIVLLLVVITNPLIPKVRHPGARAAILGIPLLVMVIFCMVAAAK
jgi:hypothetical protein